MTPKGLTSAYHCFMQKYMNDTLYICCQFVLLYESLGQETQLLIPEELYCYIRLGSALTTGVSWACNKENVPVNSFSPINWLL